MQDKHLNSTQFSAEVGIAPGTLSHIRSGRTEPTLNILRSIALAFPDVNPAWLFYGEEPMYKTATPPTPEQEETDATYLNNVAPNAATGDTLFPQFVFAEEEASSSKVNAGAGAASARSIPQAVAAGRRTGGVGTPFAPVNVQEIVAETLKQHQKPPRRVVEVRIFFDDGTFETFGAK